MILDAKDFLKLRFEVTRNYPGCPFRVGDILYANEFENEIFIKVALGGDKIWPLLYKDHFKPLRWHDHRTLEQLLSIKYMKVVSGSSYYGVGDIVEVTEIHYNDRNLVGGRHSILFNLKGHYFNITQLNPATKEEHDKFWDTQKTKF